MSSAAWAHRHDPPAWSPDKTELGRLATQASPIQDYSIQAPPNWDPQLRGGPGKVGTEFDGPDDISGNHPFLMVMLMGLPDWGIDKRTPADFLDLRLNNVKHTVNGWTPSKYENGVINGIPFARCRWTGTTPKEGNPVTGFMYCGRDGVYIIEIQAEMLSSQASDLQPLLDAAAMTLQKMPKPMAMASPRPSRAG